MTSTAGQSGLFRESAGNGGMPDARQVAHATRQALTGSGQDENIESTRCAAHYLTICELVQRHVGEGTVLDVGCGDGRLFHYLTEHAGMPATLYTGIDCCGEAVRCAAARFPEAGFARRDYRSESVASRFDCVIFNDSLQCFDDPATVLDKCVDRNMHACSVLIVAMVAGRDDAARELLAQRYRVVDEQRISETDGSVWVLRAMRLQDSQHC